jgi:hypothetical protein
MLAVTVTLQVSRHTCRRGGKGSPTPNALRHSEHAHLLSDIEKLTLPILGSMFPFWIPTGDLVCQLEATST